MLTVMPAQPVTRGVTVIDYDAVSDVVGWVPEAARQNHRLTLELAAMTDQRDTLLAHNAALTERAEAAERAHKYGMARLAARPQPGRLARVLALACLCWWDFWQMFEEATEVST
jgi:hypothetical protein